jgi:hypothetical protein
MTSLDARELDLLWEAAKTKLRAADRTA